MIEVLLLAAAVALCRGRWLCSRDESRKPLPELHPSAVNIRVAG